MFMYARKFLSYIYDNFSQQVVVALCWPQVRYLQRCHIKQRRLGDISFNFLVGGDGNVYEGRGWTTACGDDTTGLPLICTFHDFQVENLCRRQQRALQGLLQMAVARRTLAKNYQLLVLHPILDTIMRHWSKPEDMEVVNREKWGTIDPEHTYFLTDQLTYVIISHSVFQFCSSSKQENIEYIRYIQNVHAHEMGWGDIGYNFLIGGDGRVYEGRGWHAKSAHTYAYNHLALGVCFVGDFRVEAPSEVQLQACQKLLRIAVARGQLAPHYKLVGHCQVRNTASPGQALMEVIKTWPHWSSQL
ncbi:hypothetical protein B566_EDAN005909 [Ephemera danica]|nr:hypothetical protein B566_EDAN005909 [Ephemera danica]